MGSSILKWIGLSGNDKKGNDAANEWLAQTGEERFYGFENYGNTCYCNSVLQALYYCQPFRECVMEYTPLMLGSNYVRGSLGQSSPLGAAQAAPPVKTSAFDFKRDKKKDAMVPQGPSIKSAQEARSEKEVLEFLEAEETLLSTLKDLFFKIQAQKKRTGVMGPQQFVTRLRKESEIFRSSMHHDAQEFMMFTLNTIGETLIRQQKDVKRFQQRPHGSAMNRLAAETSTLNGRPSQEDSRAAGANEEASRPDSANNTWMHKLFEGQLVNETRCLTCETVSSRDEPFLDLSIDVEQHASLSTCLRNFSKSETLTSKEKFFCDKCCSLQEAEKRMKIKKLPNILAIHLKRFKYQEKLQRMGKLSYRVVFPLELRVFNTSDDAENADRLYNLFAAVNHIGSGGYHGHYVTIAKTHDQWVLFDDDAVEPVDEAYLQRYFGDTNQSGCGYIFFYAAADFDSSSILKSMGYSPSQHSAPPKMADLPSGNGRATPSDFYPAQAPPVDPSFVPIARTSLAADGGATASVVNGLAQLSIDKPAIPPQPPLAVVTQLTPVSGGIPVSPSSTVSDNSSNGAGKKKKDEKNGDGAFGWLPFGKKRNGKD